MFSHSKCLRGTHYTLAVWTCVRTCVGACYTAFCDSAVRGFCLVKFSNGRLGSDFGLLRSFGSYFKDVLERPIGPFWLAGKQLRTKAAKQCSEDVTGKFSNDIEESLEMKPLKISWILLKIQKSVKIKSVTLFNTWQFRICFIRWHE
jgi:hypothetical protein